MRRLLTVYRTGGTVRVRVCPDLSECVNVRRSSVGEVCVRSRMGPRAERGVATLGAFRREECPMPAQDTAHIVFDIESVPDGALLSRTLYPGDGLAPDDAIRRYRSEHARDGDEEAVFVPVSFHVPVAIGAARVGSDFRLLDLVALDAPRHDPRSMVELFWRGVQIYGRAALVDFNGRGFDIPLLTLCAFRFGISCPRYFDDDRYGFRYRFTDKHIDLMDWLTEYGAYRLTGGLNLCAKMLGKPGKMGTTGASVAELHRQGRIQEINDYCLHDVLDTYFVFLRTRVVMGRLPLADEQRIVDETRALLETRSATQPALRTYLERFGRWDPTPFAEHEADSAES
jgi:predicted PolB exonuclease-like 3'-5' exonuclease